MIEMTAMQGGRCHIFAAVFQQLNEGCSLSMAVCLTTYMIGSFINSPSVMSRH